jgi:hypothetical protein
VFPALETLEQLRIGHLLGRFATDPARGGNLYELRERKDKPVRGQP